jgi:hypothetical protein
MYEIILATKKRDRMVPLQHMSPNPGVGNSLIFCCKHNAHNAAKPPCCHLSTAMTGNKEGSPMKRAITRLDTSAEKRDTKKSSDLGSPQALDFPQLLFHKRRSPFLPQTRQPTLLPALLLVRRRISEAIDRIQDYARSCVLLAVFRGY